MTVELKPRILVFGVGGAGGNAVNNMIASNLQGVDFVVANTDAQALLQNKAGNKIQLGVSKTEGLGAGAKPSVGRDSAVESLEEIDTLLEGAHMVFIAAGMGGGTGTGAAPVIAKAARDKGILTVGVVTKPFDFEGRRRMDIADEGVMELRDAVDTLIIIPNQNLFRIANANTTFAEAFTLADEVLHKGVRGITDLMIMPGLINLDFADVRTVMSEMGAAMMGTGEASGEERAVKAAQLAIANPLLDDVSMKGAKGVLINITGSYDMTLYEVDAAANEVRREVDPEAQIILGSTFDQNLDGKIRVSVVATGISASAYADLVHGAVSSAPHIEELQQPDAPETAVADAPTIVTRPDTDEPDAETAPVEMDEAPVINARPSIVTDVEEDVAQPMTAEDVSYEQPPEESADSSSDSSKFSSLFGWRKQDPHADTPPAEAPKAEDELQDDELEIPAFLRRSANT